ncbi:MAG: Ig-like domain-containing protein [Oscillospiraceae bacterium]|nr:Ig-like domain-containing protein [Oscillospiraceae bacterium]
MKKRYVLFLTLVILLAALTVSACTQDPGETLGYLVGPTDQVIHPFANSATTPAIEFMRWQFEDEASRDGYTLIPTHFADTGICVTSAFILTVSSGSGTPNISIDGQPAPVVMSEGENRFRVSPSVPLSYNSLYIVRLANIGTEDTTWAFQTTARLQISAILPAHQSTNVPVNTGIEISFSLGGHTPIDEFFSIAPAVDGRFITRGNTSVFMPTNPLRFGEIYTVTISAGIKVDGTNEIITDDLVFSFETQVQSDFEGRQDHNAAQVHFSTTYAEFPTFEAPHLNFWLSYNSNNRRPRIDVSIHQFHTANDAVNAIDRLVNIPHWATVAHERNQIETSGLRYIDSFNITRADGDRWMETMTLPGNLPPGFYVISATAQERTSQAVLQITDIATQVIADDDQAIVWINDMITGTPLTGAEVLDPASGNTFRTDENGIAIVQSNVRHSEALSRLIVRADTRENVVILQASGGIRPHPISGGHGRISGFDMWWGPRNQADDNYWSVLHLDRTLFQRVDTLHFWGFAANRHTGAPLDNVTAVLTSGSWGWDGTDDTPLHRQTISVADGAFSGDINLPHLDPGSYQLTIYFGDTTIASQFFEVRDFVKPPYRLTISADRHAVFIGDTVNFTARGEFFEGTPVAELDISYSLWGWQLQNDRRGSGRTNTDGVVEVSSQTIRASADGQGRASLDFVVEATLPEIGWTMQHESISVFINDIEVRSRATRTGSDANLSIEVDRITLDRLNDETAANRWDYIDGPQAGQQLNVEIVRVWWEAIRTGERYDFVTRAVVPTYRHERREQVIESFELLTDSEGKASRDFTVPNRDRESYLARVRTTCGFGRAITHEAFIGRDWSGFFGNAGNNELFLDGARSWDEGYSIGDDVQLTVMRGEAQVTTGNVLFVVANMGIVHHQVGSSVLEFTFDEAHLPGATVHAIFFNGHTYHAGWAMTRQLHFDRDSRALDIDIAIDGESFRPGEMASVTVTTRDTNGNPRPAHVNFSVVDEALFALRDNEIDTLAALYRRVSSGIIINYASHGTFVSDGIDAQSYGLRTEMAMSAPAAAGAAMEMADDSAVGGGADTHVRELFEDTAYFHSVTTNARGEASFSFRLPDNITAWRLTASGITTDFYAGNATEPIRVTLPMFLNYSLNNVFLVGDMPYVGITVFGTALTGAETVTFTVWDDRTPENVITATGRPFERVNIPLWEMTMPGAQAMVIHVETSTGLSDALRHSYHVLESHRTVDTAVFYDVTLDTVFEIGRPGLTNITFTDRGRGQFLWQLMSMRHVRGDRIEGLVMRREANHLIRQYFPDMDIYFMSDAFDPSMYQQADGGIAMLPHASSDLALTVSVLPFIRDEINKQTLGNYLTNIFLTSTGENRIIALYGLAQLGAPVIQELHTYARTLNLSTSDAAYLALGLLEVGERHRAVALYEAHIAPHLQELAPYYRIIGDDQLRDTAVVARLAQQLGLSERDGLHGYTQRHRRDDLLTQVDRLRFISHEIGAVDSVAASITYTMLGQSFTQELSGWRHFTLRIPTMHLNEFAITAMTGDVGAVSVHSVPLEEIEAIDNDITVRRQFFKAGSRTPATSFSEGDLVRVEITIDYTRSALTGTYAITDFLPSGLVFVQDSARISEESSVSRSRAWATSEGQRVIFFDHNSRVRSVQTVQSYFYYARVISPGTFIAEGTIVQNLGVREYLTIGESAVIRIAE